MSRIGRTELYAYEEEPLPVVNWPTQLLASSLSPGDFNPQQESPLLRLPGELRQRIYNYVFTADWVSWPELLPSNLPTTLDARNRIFYRGWSLMPRVHAQLLRTCRAVYHEASVLPVSLNPAYVFDLSSGSPMERMTTMTGAKPGLIHSAIPAIPEYLAAWQFANISSLVMQTDQSGLEQEPGHLKRYSEIFLTKRRHEGIKVAAREGHGKDMHDRPPAFDYPHNDPVKKYHVHAIAPDSDGGEVQPTGDETGLQFYPARTITHLTYRLDRTNWWAHTGSPHPDQGLALDPALGDGSSKKRPMPIRMDALANERRQRRERGESEFSSNGSVWSDICWGWRLCTLFPGLRRFTLHLETYAPRAAELDRIVECAKTWIFPIEDGTGSVARVLRWDGNVVESSWGEDLQPRPGVEVDVNAPKGFVVRVISWC